MIVVVFISTIAWKLSRVSMLADASFTSVSASLEVSSPVGGTVTAGGVTGTEVGGTVPVMVVVGTVPGRVVVTGAVVPLGTVVFPGTELEDALSFVEAGGLEAAQPAISKIPRMQRIAKIRFFIRDTFPIFVIKLTTSL